MSMLSKAVVLTAVSAVLAVLAKPVAAGVVLVDSSRSIFTQGPGIDQTNTAAGTSPFNSTISKSGTFQSTTFQASASQNSSITSTSSSLHVSATGTASFSVNGSDLSTLPNGTGNIEGNSSYSVTFQLTSPEAYTVVEQTDHQTQPSPGSDLEAQSNGAELLMGTKEIIPFPLFALSSSAPQTFTGMLAAGTYTFKGSASAFDISSSGSASFSADLTVGSGTAAVPLPPALWMALTSLAAVLPAMRPLTRRWQVSGT